MSLYPGTSLFPGGTVPFPEDGGELPPAVTTGAAVITGPTTASLAGSIDPYDLQAHYFFEWGASEAYGSQTFEAVAGTAPVNVLQVITGVTGSGYHYRLVAWTAAGTTYGLDRMFSSHNPAPLSYLHEAGKGQY